MLQNNVTEGLHQYILLPLSLVLLLYAAFTKTTYI